jgi:hypothetical protein
VSDENPYRAPTAALGPIERPKHSLLGPVLAGLLAIGLAAIFARGSGLIVAFVVVGSWWASKFRPQTMAPEAPGVSEYLQRLEESPTANGPSAEPSEPTSEQISDVLGNLRL